MLYMLKQNCGVPTKVAMHLHQAIGLLYRVFLTTYLSNSVSRILFFIPSLSGLCLVGMQPYYKTTAPVLKPTYRPCPIPSKLLHVLPVFYRAASSQPCPPTAVCHHSWRPTHTTPGGHAPRRLLDWSPAKSGWNRHLAHQFLPSSLLCIFPSPFSGYFMVALASV
jgi:hypothetical protein